jgi:hypothetical protein
MFMEWDYVPVLWPPTGILLIPPRWYMSMKSQSQEEEHGKRYDEFCLQSVSFILIGFFNMLSIYDMGPMALLPLWRKLCYSFLSPLKVLSYWARFEPVNLGSNGKHATTRPPKVTSYTSYHCCVSFEWNWFCMRRKIIKLLVLIQFGTIIIQFAFLNCAEQDIK